jgi:hypothetical protein
MRIATSVDLSSRLSGQCRPFRVGIARGLVGRAVRWRIPLQRGSTEVGTVLAPLPLGRAFALVSQRVARLCILTRPGLLRRSVIRRRRRRFARSRPGSD